MHTLNSPNLPITTIISLNSSMFQWRFLKHISTDCTHNDRRAFKMMISWRWLEWSSVHSLGQSGQAFELHCTPLGGMFNRSYKHDHDQCMYQYMRSVERRIVMYSWDDDIVNASCYSCPRNHDIWWNGDDCKDEGVWASCVDGWLLRDWDAAGHWASRVLPKPQLAQSLFTLRCQSTNIENAP